MQSLKTSQDRSGSISLLQANKCASSYTGSEVEALTYSTMDAEVMNTSLELCSIPQSLKQHGKCKQTQAVEACSKNLKTVNILLSKTNQETTSVKICDTQYDSITKKVEERIKHSDRLCQAFSEKL